MKNEKKNQENIKKRKPIFGTSQPILISVTVVLKKENEEEQICRFFIINSLSFQTLLSGLLFRLIIGT
jgi:hypothetical protein